MKRTYQYIGEIALKNDCTLEWELLQDGDIDPWLFLVLDKKGERRFTFFYIIENYENLGCENPSNIRMSFIMDEMEKKINLGQTYDVWKGEKPIGTINIISRWRGRPSVPIKQSKENN